MGRQRSARWSLAVGLTVAMLVAPAGGVLAHEFRNATYYCSLSSSITPNPAAEGATLTHRVTFCQTYTGWSTVASYNGSTRLDTAGPVHLSAGQTTTVTMTFALGSAGPKDIHAYIVASMATPSPSLYNGYDHVDLTVVGDPTAPSVAEDHMPASWSTHAHPHWTWSATAAYGSIAKYEVDPTWAAPFQTTAKEYHPTLASGSYGVRVRAQNNVGAWGPWSGTVWAYVDTSPPTTSLALAGTAGTNGWWRSPVTATLSASDPHSGVASTSRQVDGGAWGAYTGPLGLSGDGAHTLNYYSADNLGNTEATRGSTVRIDTVAPSTSIQVGAPSVAQGGTTFVTSAARVSLPASDATSGVAATQYTLAGTTGAYTGAFGLTGADGPRGLSAWSTDAAGNTEAARAATLHLDNTPPSSALVAGTPSAPDPAGTFVSSATPLDVRADDAGVGVGTTRYRVGSGAWQEGASFRLAGPDGRYTAQTASEDLLGNAEPASGWSLQLDNTPPLLALASPAPDTVTLPSTSLALPLPDCEAGTVPCAADVLAKRHRPAVVVGGATVALRSAASDPVVNGVASGMALVRYTLDGALLAEVRSAPWGFDWDTGGVAGGERLLVATAIDRVGNEASVERKVLVVPATVDGAVATGVWAADLAGGLAGGGLPPVQPPTLPGVEPPGVPPVGPPAVPSVPDVRPAFSLIVDPSAPRVTYRVGVVVDGQFVGAEGAVPS